MKKVARSMLQSLASFRYHSRHRGQALRVLRNIESRKGKTPTRELKQCNEYAIDVLGHRRYAPWLYVYTAVCGRFREGWIPDNYYGAVVVPNLNGAYAYVSKLKSLNPRLFQSDVFPDLVCYTNGLFVDRSGRVVPPRALPDILFKDNQRVVFKADHSHQGRSVYTFDRESFDLERITTLGSGIFQSFVRQHDVFNEFARSPVATLRLTTFMDHEGNVSVRGCYLRLGIEGETHVQVGSLIRVAVDPRSGALADIGFTPEWTEIEAHPSNGVRFSGKSIPSFAECVRTVTSLHQTIPYARCIGWDCTVGFDERVRVLEWNAAHNDIKFTEATQGPCFADLGWERLWRIGE